MIYFDNASTTRVDDDIIDLMAKSMRENFGNPSSLHSLGFKAEKEVEKARKTIADRLGVDKEDFFFVPSGTIANNAVIKSSLVNKKNPNLVTTSLEHSSIYNLVTDLKDCELRLVKTDGFGFVDLEDLEKKIDENTVLVSIIHVNNELATINDLYAIGSVVKKKNPSCLFHSDGVQAFCKIEADLSLVDFYTVTSHKINGPQAIAGLYIKNPSSFNPLYLGGKQEKGVFPATENVAGIEGFAKAVEKNQNYDKIEKLNGLMREEILKIEDSRINSPRENSSPYILSLCFKNIKAEVLLHYLEMDEVYVSTGSACNKGAKSRVIENLGVDKDYSDGCIRVSFDKNSSEEEVFDFIRILKEKIEIIRSIMR